MKTLKKTTYVLAIALALIFTGCSKDDDGGGGGAAAAGTMTAKVDGSTVTTLEMTTYASMVSQGGASVLIVQGNTGGTSSKAFNLQITGVDGPGTYEIGGDFIFSAIAAYIEVTVDPSNPTAAETDEWVAPFDGGEVVGEIKISELTDANVKGTFRFSAKHQENDSMKEITEGSFDVDVNQF